MDTLLGDKVEVLVHMRDGFLSEIEALKNKIAGLDIAIELLIAEKSATPFVASRRKKYTIVDLIIDLLEEVKGAGLNASVVDDLSKTRGMKINRNSVSSILSRMKNDGTVVYENSKYKLKKFSALSVGAPTTTDALQTPMIDEGDEKSDLVSDSEKTEGKLRTIARAS